jgi:hypothetical protein
VITAFIEDGYFLLFQRSLLEIEVSSIPSSPGKRALAGWNIRAYSRSPLSQRRGGLPAIPSIPASPMIGDLFSLTRRRVSPDMGVGGWTLQKAHMDI